jgi:hypothetical protein
MTERFKGPYGQQGSKHQPERHVKVNGNKGVMSAYMAQKRLEAEQRNAATPDHKRRERARERGYKRISDMPTEE